MDPGLEGGIAAGVAAFVVVLLSRLRKPRARVVPGSGESLLVYGRPLQAFAIIGVGFATFMTTVALWAYFLMPDHNGWSPALVVAVMGTFWLLGGVLAIEVFRAWCRFSPATITRHSPWRGTLTVRWDEIESIRYEMSAGWYVLRSPRGKIHLEAYLDGIDEFIHAARERIPAERWGPRIRSS